MVPSRPAASECTLRGRMLRPIRSAFRTVRGGAGIAGLAAASGLPLRIFRAEHVRERIDRALAAEERRRTSTRWRCACASDGARPRALPPHRGRLALGPVPRPGAVRGARAARPAAGCSSAASACACGRRAARTGSSCGRWPSSSTALGVLERAELLGSDLLEENLAVARAGHATTSSTSARRCVAGRAGSAATSSASPRPAARGTASSAATWPSTSSPPPRRGCTAGSPAPCRPAASLVLGRSERLADPGASACAGSEPHVYERPRMKRRAVSPEPDRPGARRRRRARCLRRARLRAAAQRDPLARRRQPRGRAGARPRARGRRGARTAGDRRRDRAARLHHHRPARVPRPHRRRPRRHRRPQAGASPSLLDEPSQRAIFAGLSRQIDSLLPGVDRARRSAPPSARAPRPGALVATGEGRRRVDEMRRQFDAIRAGPARGGRQPARRRSATA